MKKQLIKILGACSMIMSVLFMAGCGNQTPQDKTIGLVISTLDNPFFVSMKNGAEQTAKAEGYNLVVLDSRNDPVKELANVQDLVTKQIKIILINPTDSAAVSNAVKYANQHDVKVITLDRTADQGKVSSHIASNNVEGGKMAAKFIADRLDNEGKVIELEGIPGASATIERGQGFKEGLAKTNLDLVASQPAGFDRAQGLNVTQNLLQAQPRVNAIFAQNDEMALGAIRAVSEAKRKGIVIVGFDGTKEGIEAVKMGKMAATIAQQPYLIGQLGVEAAVKALMGKNVNPSVTVPLRLVTRQNA